MKKKTTEQFIKESNLIHNFKYDYSKTNYVNARIKVCIICPEHGEFWQKPNSHLQGCGCPLCCCNIKSNTSEFIQKAKEIHGNKYDYSKVNYIDSKTKVCIICPEHGEFWQKPYDHLHSHGCSKCSGNGKITTDEFIQKAREVHGDKYDYSKVNYVNSQTKVCIICPEHGEFWQTPSDHLRGHSCPNCGLQLISIKNSKTIDDYINKCNCIHNNKYDYTCSNYIDYATKVCIICPEHGKFWQNLYDHSTGHGCPKCANQQSVGEEEIINFIKENNNDNYKIIVRDKKLISPYEIDIYIPEKQLAIEYNGMIWHSEKFAKSKNYHLTKTEKCKLQDVSLIHIFEYEWLHKQNIVKSKIKHILGKDNNLLKVFARKCIIKEINKDLSKKFLEKNHIQGSCNASIHLGCFYKNELIGVMSFKKERKENNRWELTRFATDITKHCVGVGGKLFTYFIRNYNPEYVKSFADRRWTLDKDNNLYTKLGFKLEKILKPDYKYTRGANEYIHKFNFRKQILIKQYPYAGLTEDMTECEMTQKLGFHKIWDCGLFKYVWKNI